jgi:hypothetical protein
MLVEYSERLSSAVGQFKLPAALPAAIA